ncbi:MAG: hypothetical protein ACM3PY_06210 [Omnitrophica WOR_2 bacterium]
MAQRSIQVGMNPTVVIKTGTGVSVEGWDKGQVRAETPTRGGLRVEARRQSEISRARAAVGDHLLFDVRLKLPGSKKSDAGDTIEVHIGGEGKVRVPRDSRVKVYAGKEVQVSDIQGPVVLFTGGDVLVRGVRSLAHISSGGAVDLECDTIEGNEAKFEAGLDLRCSIRSLSSARVIVSDLDGDWEGLIGSGEMTLRLKAGGNVTLVTDQRNFTGIPRNSP